MNFNNEIIKKPKEDDKKLINFKPNFFKKLNPDKVFVEEPLLNKREMDRMYNITHGIRKVKSPIRTNNKEIMNEVLNSGGRLFF